jgi:hypothetical protein
VREAAPPPMRAAGFAVAPIAAPEMLARVYAFDEHAYDAASGAAGGNIAFALFEEWWTAFPAGFLCAYIDGEPQAVVGLFPVSAAWASGFLSYATSEHELRAADIAASDRRTWYFSGLSSNARAGRLGMRLPCVLGHAILQWSQIIAMGDAITIVAEGTTSIGAKLLGRLLAPVTLPAPDDARRRPRIKATIDRAGVRHLLLESPFFRRCRDVRESAVSL